MKVADVISNMENLLKKLREVDPGKEVVWEMFDTYGEEIPLRVKPDYLSIEMEEVGNNKLVIMLDVFL